MYKPFVSSSRTVRLFLHTLLELIAVSRCFVLPFNGNHHIKKNCLSRQHQRQSRLHHASNSWRLSTSERRQVDFDTDNGDYQTNQLSIFPESLKLNHFANLSVSEIQLELVRLGVALQRRQQQLPQQQQQQQQQKPTEREIIHNIGNISIRSSLKSSNRFNSDAMLRRAQEFKSPYQRVPGCVANVQIQALLQVMPPRSKNQLRTASSKSSDLDESDKEILYKVSLQGQADAMLSRGLVCVLANYVEQQQQQQQPKHEPVQGSWSSSIEYLLKVPPRQVADDLHLRQALSSGRNDGLANMMSLFQTQLQRLLLEVSQQRQQREKLNIPTPSPQEPIIASAVTPRRQWGIFRSRIWKNAVTPPIKTFAAGGKALERMWSLLRGLGKANSKAPTVAVLLSGGVDSSVALALLRRQNYNCTAFYLKIWLEDELAHLGVCPWEDDYRTCQQVCRQLNVPLEALSLQKEYKETVMAYTLAEAKKGRTPNPDIICNSRVKFGCFYDAIAGRGFDFVASGHYAQILDVLPNTRNGNSNDANKTPDTPQRALLRASDPVKDQSYFLCALSQKQLQRVLFPIGHLQKFQVRELAHDLGLPNRNRPDSQGLCFLGKVKFEEFLHAYLGEETGDVLDAATGELLGRHRGVWYHTVGQRKGLGKVLYPKATSRGPWYVVAKDPVRRVVYCSNTYDEDIFTSARSAFHVEDIHWIAGAPPHDLLHNGGRHNFHMKIRHGPQLVEGTLELVHDGCMDNQALSSTGKVRLNNKDSGLAPGQFVAFYQGLECLGGGVISERHWADFLSSQQVASAQLA